MATLKGSTIASTYIQLVKRADSYSQTGTNIELMIADGTIAPTGLYLESGATTDNVGIGVADPDATLEILDTTTQLKLSYDSTNYAAFSVSADGLLNLFTDDPSGAEADICFNPDGNVGIGTLIPMNTLHVSHNIADGDNGIMIVNEQTTISDGELLGAIGFDGADGNIPSSCLEASCFIAAYAAEAHSASAKGGDLVFGCTLNGTADDQTSVEYMRILDSGNGGIGTAAPAVRLTVGNLDADVDTFIRVQADAGNTTGLQFVEEGDHLWTLQSAGSGNNLQVYDHGDSSIASSIATTDNDWQAGSDLRIKKDITNIDSVLDSINNLRPITWKRKYGKTDRIYPGLIAQEAKPYFPLVVNGTEDSFKEITKDDKLTYEGGLTIGYSNLVPYLIKAIQELSAKVTALENA